MLVFRFLPPYHIIIPPEQSNSQFDRDLHCLELYDLTDSVNRVCLFTLDVDEIVDVIREFILGESATWERTRMSNARFHCLKATGETLLMSVTMSKGTHSLFLGERHEGRVCTVVQQTGEEILEDK